MNRPLLRQRKSRTRYGRHVGKAPVLIVRSRKASVTETSECTFAKLSEPRQITPDGPLLEFGKTFEIVFNVLNCGSHVLCYAEAGAVCPAWVSMETYPLFSSSRASSGPPERTMRH